MPGSAKDTTVPAGWSAADLTASVKALCRRSTARDPDRVLLPMRFRTFTFLLGDEPVTVAFGPLREFVVWHCYQEHPLKLSARAKVYFTDPIYDGSMPACPATLGSYFEQQRRRRRASSWWKWGR